MNWQNNKGNLHLPFKEHWKNTSWDCGSVVRHLTHSPLQERFCSVDVPALDINLISLMCMNWSHPTCSKEWCRIKHVFDTNLMWSKLKGNSLEKLVPSEEFPFSFDFSGCSLWLLNFFFLPLSPADGQFERNSKFLRNG